jgi:hypothetical protein
MKPILYLFVPPLLSSGIAAATSCNDFGPSGVVCTGPDGYSSTQHNYGAGMSTYQDSSGNTASIHRYPAGATVVIPGGNNAGTPGTQSVPPGMGVNSMPGIRYDGYR